MVYPRRDGDEEMLGRLKTSDLITYWGYIEGVTLRHIKIDPAIIVRKSKKRSR